MPAQNRQNATFAPPAGPAAFPGGSVATDGAGLSLNRLENVHAVNGKTVARCPACAEDGHDKTGDHIVIDAEGRFGCIKYQGAEGADHRRRIFALAGEIEPRQTAPRKTSQKAVKRVEGWADTQSAAEALTPQGYRLADVYLYDKQGAAFAAVARYENGAEKTFRQFNFAGGKWLSGAPAGDWPLYLGDGIGAGVVYIVEGEKACNAALSIGLNATTSAGGSGAAMKSDWRPLAGRDVAILPDADKPGEKYAGTVSGILLGLGCSVRILRLPGLPEAGDIFDYIELHPETTAETIEAMAAAVAPEGAPADPLAAYMASANDYLKTPPPPHDAAIDGLCDIGDILALIAKAKSYKTWLLMQAGATLATGTSFIGFDVPKPRRVLFVNPEVRPHWMHRRVQMLAASMGFDSIRNLHFLHTRGTGFSWPEIRRAAAIIRAEVIAIDSVYKFMPDDENASDVWKTIMLEIDTLAEATGALIILCHHDGKGHAGERSIVDRGSGSGVLGRAYDSAIALAPHATDPEAIIAEVVARNYPQPETRVLKWNGGSLIVNNEIGAIIETAGSRANRISKTPPLEDYFPAVVECVDGGAIPRGVLEERLKQATRLGDSKILKLINLALHAGEIAKTPRLREKDGRVLYGTPSEVASIANQTNLDETGAK